MNRRSFFKHAVCILFLVFAMGEVWGAEYTYTSKQDGDWNSKQQWTINGGDAQYYPRSNDILNKDIAIVQNALTATSNVNCKNVQIIGGGSVTVTGGTFKADSLEVTNGSFSSTQNLEIRDITVKGDGTLELGGNLDNLNSITIESGGKIVLNTWPTPAPTFNDGCIVEIGPSFPTDATTLLALKTAMDGKLLSVTITTALTLANVGTNDYDTITIKAGGSLTVPTGVTVTAKRLVIEKDNASSGSLSVAGTMTFSNDSSNKSVNSGTISIDTTGSLKFDNTPRNAYLLNLGIITNCGVLDVNQLENGDGSTKAEIIADGTTFSAGLLTNKKKSEVTYESGTTLNGAGIDNAGKITIKTGCSVNIGIFGSDPYNGAVKNSGDLIMETSAILTYASFENTGYLVRNGACTFGNFSIPANTIYVENKGSSEKTYTLPSDFAGDFCVAGNVNVVTAGQSLKTFKVYQKTDGNTDNDHTMKEDFTVKLTGTGLNVVGRTGMGDNPDVGLDLSRTSRDANKFGTLSVECPLTVDYEIFLHTGTIFNIKEAVTAGLIKRYGTDFEIKVNVAQGKTLSTDNLYLNNSMVTLANDGTVQITNGGAFEVDSCTAGGNITFKAGGSLTANSLAGNTLTVNTTGAQTFTLNSNVTFADVILEGSNGNVLSVDGTGDFSITDGSKSLADYVDFQSSDHPTIKKDGNEAGIIATNSSAPGTPQQNFPAGWLDGNKFFVWKGTTDTEWVTSTNWLRNNSPTGKTDIEKITIDTTGNNNPVISADVTTKELEFKNSKSAKLSGSKLTVEKISGTGTLDLGSGTLINGLTPSGTELEIPSTIGLKFGDGSSEEGTLQGKIKIKKVENSSGKLNIGTSTTASTVNFDTSSAISIGSVVLSKSDSSVTFGNAVTLSGGLTNSGSATFKGKLTANGTVSNSGTVTASGALTAGGTFTNNSNSTFTANGDVTVNGDFTNGGTVNGAGAFTFKGAFTDSGTWNGTGNFTFRAGTEKNITGKDSKEYPFTTVTGKAKFVEDFIIGGNGLWIDGGTVSVDSGKSLTVNNNVSKTSGTLSGDGTIKIYGDFSDKGTTSISNIIFFGDKAHKFTNVAETHYKTIKLDPSIINSVNFTVNNNAKITTFTDESAESKVTFNGTATLGSLTVNNASTYTFQNDATITSLTDGTGGSYDFKANATVNSAVTFSKTVTFGGNATFHTATPVAPVDAIFSKTVTFTKDGASLIGDDVVFKDSVSAGTINLSITASSLELNVGNTVTFASKTLTLTGSGTTLKHGTTGSKISITGDVVSDTSLTVSDPLYISGAVTINIGKSLTASGTLETGTSLTNNGTFTGNQAVTLGTTLANSGTLTGNAPISVGTDFINSGTATGNSTITVFGMLTNEGTISSKSIITVNGDCTNNAGGIISDVDATNKGKLELGANFTDAGTTSIDEIIFWGNKDHTFTNNASNQYKSVTLAASISDAKTVTVVNDAKITTFTDNTAKANVNFSGTSTLGSISTASHTAGKYTFTGDSKVLADTTYNTDVEYGADALFQTDATPAVPVDAKFSNTVTFTKDGASLIGDDVVFYDSVSAGTINLSITASSLELNVGNTVTFASKTLTLTGTGTTLKHGTTGSKIFITGSLVSDTSLTVSDPLYISGAVTINAGKTLTANDTLETGTNLTNSGTLTGEKSITVGGELINGGTFTGEKSITVGGDLTNGGTFTGKDTLSVDGALTNSGTFKGNSITATGDCTNNANASLAPNDPALPSSLSFKANFTDNGTTNIDKLIFLGATHQFKPGTSTYTEIEVTSPVTNLSVITVPLKATTFTDDSASGILTFEKAVDLGTATFNKPGVTFNTDATITNFTALNGGTFDFMGKATITTFDDKKTGAYTFTGDASIQNLTDGEGGSYDFKANATVHSDVEFRSTVTFGSDAVFQDSATPPLPVDAKFCKTVTFTKDVGSLTAKDIIFESTAVMGADAASNNTITAKNLTINGDFTAQGKLNFTLDTSLTISGTGTNLSALAEWNLSSPKLTFSSAAININTPKLTLLGTDTTFTQSQSFTGAHKLTGELHVGLSGTFNLDAPFIAGGNVYLSSGTSIASGAKLYCGADFRAKDITLGGDVAIRSNENWKECFAEAVDCTISGSEVYWWDGNDILSAEKSGTKAVIPCENCTDGGSNLNWYFDDITFVKARTISDHEIELTVTDKAKDFLLNTDNSISSFVKGQGKSHNGGYNNASNIKYTVTSVKEDSQNQNQAIITLKADKTWNTDATGTATGNSLSTDADGASQYGKEKPVVSIGRGDGGSTESYTITNKWGKRFASYDGSAANPVFDKATDGAAPVLLYVYTGQENHTRASSTVYPSYDAHNFLEFVYSEPVAVYKHSEIYAGGGTVPDISGATPVLAHDVAAENLSSVAQDLGSFENKSGDGVNIYGVAGFEKGHLVTKKHNAGGPDQTDNTLNSFYRKSTSDNGTSFRYAIAALCGPTPLKVGNELFQDYAGYIEEIAIIGGAVSEPVAGTSCVIDLKGNASNLVRNGGVLVQSARSGGVGVDSFADETIGIWDVIGPDFVPVRKQTDDWDGLLDRTVNFEISGTATAQSSTLSGVEFHFFDNKPSYSSQDQAQWFLRTGWTDHNGNLKLGIDKYGKNASYAAEFFGGSRAFAQNDGARTSGGIRYSSLKKASENGVFTYKTVDGRGVLSQDERNFGKELTAGERALIFSSLDVNYTREVNYFDSPYFGINLPDQTSELRTTFEITYNQDKGVITDLAGNKLHCEGQKRSVRSIDMTPPQFNMTVAAVGSKKLFVMLTKKIQIDNLVLRDSTNNVVPVSDSALDDMPKSLGFAKLTDGQKPVLVTDITIDDTVPAKVLFAGDNFTGLEFALNQEATFENMENLYLVVKRVPELVGVRDPVTGIVTVVSYIQDELGNFMTENQAHIFSDFAVNAVTPLYAYSEGEQYATAGESLFDNLYGDTNYSVHDFTKDQQNYGTMMTGGDMVVVAKVPSSFTSAKQLRLWASSAPENGSVSTELNKLAGTDLRVWLPGLFTPFAQKANTNSVSVGGTELNGNGLSGGVKNTIPSSAGFVDGDTVTFMYELMAPDGSTKEVCHQPKLNIDGTVTLSENGETFMAPLYALNLEDPSDILSLDLWSFKLKAVQSQRGGVSILNNVINSSLGEKTLVKVDVPNGGADVTVCVMTLDGNIIRYLHTGKETAGTHYYDWDGSNMNGKACARGMYFVRVFGTGFDETRKVMVVK